jgi:hypothetical protein
MAKVNGKYLNDMASLLPVELQAEFDLVKTAYNEHKALQKAFEAKVREHLAEPKLAFSYRFGKLSCSVGETEVKAVKAVAPKVNLAEWLEQQANR